MSWKLFADTLRQLQRLQAATVNTNGQIETTDAGVPANMSNSLPNGPRGYNLLEDTTVREKMIHWTAGVRQSES